MQFLKLGLMVIATLGFANAVAIVEPVEDAPVARGEPKVSFEEKRAMQAEYEAMMPRGEPSILEARALTKCPKSNGCKCDPDYVTKQGQYCGYCAAVSKAGTGGSWKHIFECSPSGKCCDYGASTKCAGDQWYNYCPS